MRFGDYSNERLNSNAGLTTAGDLRQRIGDMYPDLNPTIQDCAWMRLQLRLPRYDELTVRQVEQIADEILRVSIEWRRELNRATPPAALRDKVKAAGVMSTFSDYEAEALKTAGAAEGHKALCMGAMGLGGEAGEVVDELKKVVFHDKPLDRDAIGRELGDVLWYLAFLAEKTGWTLAEIADRNIAKLRMRHGGVFKPHAQQVRDAAADKLRAELERVLKNRDVEIRKAVEQVRIDTETTQGVQPSAPAQAPMPSSEDVGSELDKGKWWTRNDEERIAQRLRLEPPAMAKLSSLLGSLPWIVAVARIEFDNGVTLGPDSMSFDPGCWRVETLKRDTDVAGLWVRAFWEAYPIDTVLRKVGESVEGPDGVKSKRIMRGT